MLSLPSVFGLCVCVVSQTSVQVDSSGSVSAESGGVTVVTAEALAASVQDAPVLRLAILGQVFDVTKGRKHYGKDGGYAFFAGKDAARAFVTGSPHSWGD